LKGQLRPHDDEIRPLGGRQLDETSDIVGGHVDIPTVSLRSRISGREEDLVAGRRKPGTEGMLARPSSDDDHARASAHCSRPALTRRPARRQVLWRFAQEGKRRVSWSFVTADARPPAAIRITRPYATEEEYLGHEIETISRTGLTLIGAQPRPEGFLLRFELALSSGQVLVRGEGRVIGFKTGPVGGTGALALRFTRLDVRSKAFVDKASDLREQARPPVAPSSRPPASPRAPALPFPRLRRSVPPQPMVQLAPAARDVLLDRLRARKNGLESPAIEALIEQGRSVRATRSHI
jgi:hypothetical protein